MTATATQKLTRNREGMRVFQQERLILDATERICELMHEQDVSRTELALRLGKSKGYVSQMLDGTRNMTLRSVADFFLALGRAAHLRDLSIDETVNSRARLGHRPRRHRLVHSSDRQRRIANA